MLALNDEGMPQRAIAEQVFGDAGLRGRVQRILDSPPRRALPQNLAQPSRRAEECDLPAILGKPLDLSQVFAGMVVRQWRDLAASGYLPSLDPLEADLEAQGFGSNPTP